MYCPKCGKENRNGEKFCNTCGTPLEQNGNPPHKKSAERIPAPLKALPFLFLSLLLCVAMGGIFFARRLSQPEGQSPKEQWTDGLHSSDDEGQRAPGGTAREEKEPETDNTLHGAEGVTLMSRPSLFDGITLLHTDTSPCVPEVTLRPDFSNVINIDHSWLKLQDEQRALLRQNYFVVSPSCYDEFFELYEENRYRYIPNFVTIDSMTHTYHLYFARLMKNTERDYLLPALTRLSKTMLEKSSAQLRAVRGTEWEEAAGLNTVFFGVASALLDAGGDIPAELRGRVEEQLSHVRQANASAYSFTGALEDFSQYAPRGYYEGDAQLEKYFRAMMWYGRVNFTQKEEVLDRAALLMTLAMRDGGLSDWESIYTVTGFFAGVSDDSGYYEYAPLISAAYGEDAELEKLIGNAQGWERFHELTRHTEPPKINSMSVDDRNTGEARDDEIRGFRFMGQRFSVDANIFQQLVYNKVGESRGERRDLPSGLDIPAALGSDTALNILKEAGEDRFPGYAENMEQLRRGISAAEERLWNASLYSRWLYMLRPALDKKGSDYPLFMQSEAWNRKNLQSFLGSYAELKHDTVLYVKQVIAEMGSDEPDILDDRGYVEPEPELWSRLYTLTEATESGLERYGLLSANDKKNLSLLLQLIGQLKTISEKELTDTALSDAEYELIRTYGGQLEHFWQEVYRDEAREKGYGLYTKNFPAAVITDVATGFDRVLELGTGDCAKIYVLVPIDGTLRIASGTVYSYYEFPYEKRLTDAEWRIMMGLQPDASGYFREAAEISQPAWTESFTCTPRS